MTNYNKEDVREQIKSILKLIENDQEKIILLNEIINEIDDNEISLCNCENSHLTNIESKETRQLSHEQREYGKKDFSILTIETKMVSEIKRK